MRIALLSDIHSNKYALSAILDELRPKNIDKYIFLGDMFGYYPWAFDTYKLLIPFLNDGIFIKGNHDYLMVSDPPDKLPEYWDVIIQNKKDLTAEALNWLSQLPSYKSFYLNDVKFLICHGTPDDPLNGRFYPTNKNNYPWFPNRNEIVVLGHTHYPIARETEGSGLIINPGSVGQPRGDNLKSAAAILALPGRTVEQLRVDYNIKQAIFELEEINWYPRAINSLKK